MPLKPYKDFPLTSHSGGKWMKKINGRVRYFGRWGNRVKGKLERIEGDGWQDALFRCRIPCRPARGSSPLVPIGSFLHQPFFDQVDAARRQFGLLNKGGRGRESYSSPAASFP